MTTLYTPEQMRICSSISKYLDNAYKVSSICDSYYVTSPIDLFTQECFYRIDKWCKKYNWRWCVCHELGHVLVELFPLK